jgi:hypothetical protein
MGLGIEDVFINLVLKMWFHYYGFWGQIFVFFGKLTGS